MIGEEKSAMKKRYIRALAILLCVLMCVTLAPVEAVAYSGEAAENAAENAVTNGGVKITVQPQSQSVNISEKATFRVKAVGKNLKYQWFYRPDSNSSWKKVSGGTKATLSVAAKGKNGYQYRCRVSSGGKKVFSRTVKLKVSNVTYRALLIGQTYRSTGYSTLVGDRDVSLLKAALKKGKGPKGGKYKVTTKTDLSYSGIQSAIEETFANADADDVSLFYFSGHGDASSYSFGAGALVTVEDFGTDWVDLLTLSLWLRCVPGKVIVFIDSCGSGAAIYGSGRSSANAAAEAARFNQAVIDAFAAADMTIVNGDAENTGDFRESKFCVLTSSGYREDSYVYRFKEGKYSLFTYYAARGCKGAADKNGDKYITLNELYKYIHKNEGSRQHVQLYPSKSSYKLTKVS